MTLSGVIDGFSTFLSARVGTTNVGPISPAAAGDLPMVTLSLQSVEHALTSIGARPTPSRTGALPITQEFDLADSTLTFPDGEVVDLMAPDRRSLHFPYGPVVAAGGEEAANLSALDLTVTVDGAPLAVVEGAPAAGQAQGIPALGEVAFGEPLPAAGTLVLTFFIGEWEVDTARFQGELIVDTAAAGTTATETLSRSAVAELDEATITSLPGLHSLRPLALGPIAGIAGIVGGHTRQLTYQFDFEVENVNLGTGGGVIATIDVDSLVDDINGLSDPEEFEVPA